VDGCRPFIAQVTDNQLIFALAFVAYLVALVQLGWQILEDPLSRY
jgi:hypothetical protein